MALTKEQRRAAATRAAKRALQDVAPVLVTDTAIAKAQAKKIRAYAFASGHIGFTDSALPNGSLLIAYGPEGKVRATVRGLARLAYDNETLLVPGCPEADDQTAAYDAFVKFFNRVQESLGKDSDLRAVAMRG